MVSICKNWRAIQRTRSSARFVRQTPGETQTNRLHHSQPFYSARYYDPTTGEFTSRDPLEYVDGMSLMRGYFGINSIDPFGSTSLAPSAALGRYDTARACIFRKLTAMCDSCCTKNCHDDCEFNDGSGCKKEDCEAEASRIAWAIYHTLVSNWRLVWGDLHPDDQRNWGYYCYEWAFGFEDAFNLVKSGKCFTGKIGYSHVCDLDEEDVKVHYWFSITGTCSKKTIHVDDGFAISGKLCHETFPVPEGYSISGEAGCSHIGVLRSDKKLCPVTPYDHRGRKNGK